jgi:IS5 family transposase
VSDVAFHKKSRLRMEAMVKSRWVYRKLRKFRAGIDANISCLKRAFGLARCTWRGLAHFTSYVWSSVVAYNLALSARLDAEQAQSSARCEICRGSRTGDRRSVTIGNPFDDAGGRPVVRNAP